jgi:hypothetical protein
MATRSLLHVSSAQTRPHIWNHDLRCLRCLKKKRGFRLDLNLDGRVSFKEFVASIEDRKGARESLSSAAWKRAAHIDDAWAALLSRISEDPSEKHANRARESTGDGHGVDFYVSCRECFRSQGVGSSLCHLPVVSTDAETGAWQRTTARLFERMDIDGGRDIDAGEVCGGGGGGGGGPPPARGAPADLKSVEIPDGPGGVSDKARFRERWEVKRERELRSLKLSREISASLIKDEISS